MQDAPPVIPKSAWATDPGRNLKIASVFSVGFGALGTAVAFLCYRWTIFIRSVNLGKNDLNDFAYLLVEGALLLVSFFLTSSCIWAGIAALVIERRKSLPIVGTALGIVSIALIIYGFAH